MPQRMFDRVKETATTTGTGNFTLAGAVSQFTTFSSRFATGASAQAAEVFYYAIVGQTGAEWEVGKGFLSDATTLVRDAVMRSSNADAIVSFSSGTKDVFVTIPGDRVEDLFTKGQAFATSIGLNLP